MSKFVVFNWKMNPGSIKEAQNLFVSTNKEISKKEAVIVPPFVYIDRLISLSSRNGSHKTRFGSQDVSIKDGGPLTGEVSAKMLRSMGALYSIVGHSERRCLFGETDDLISQKVANALENKIIPILCVGEKVKMSQKMTITYVINQIRKDLALIDSKKGKIIVAYEPIWAIGGNKEVDPSYVADIISGIKTYLSSRGFSIKVLYGGSVNSKNIGDFLKYDHIDGFLVGSASLSVNEVKNILKLIK